MGHGAPRSVRREGLHDERLKSREAADDFDELLERIRAIRASERRFYQRITDIDARCSFDYDRSAETTRTFSATVQNKLHFAIHGLTAAELSHERADHTQPNMGLTTWKAGPAGPIRKADATVANNYLSEAELRELERIVTMFLDDAEDQARRRRAMTMADWVERLDLFLRFNEREVLPDAGRAESTRCWGIPTTVSAAGSSSTRRAVKGGRTTASRGSSARRRSSPTSSGGGSRRTNPR